MRATVRTALLMVGMVAAVVTIGSCSNSSAKQGTMRAAQYEVSSGAGVGKHFDDNRYFAHGVAMESLRDDGLHDPANPAIASLQEPAESLAAFPYDRRGAVNWVQAIEQGVIQPRETLSGAEGMLVMDMDILFTDTGKMPWVRFPHLAHTRWLDCSNCHPKIFVPRKGANNPSMDGILAGEHCGRCHDKVAFALWVCERCHSVPHEKSPRKWW